MARSVLVVAPSRLHFGLLNPHGLAPGRLYGSLGLAIDSPNTVVRLERSDSFEMPPELEAGEAEALVLFLKQRGIRGVRARVLEAPPRHVGLGSTTQLLLSLAVGALKLYGVDEDPVEVAKALKRGAISATGIYAFKHGGFIVDAGKAPGEPVAPLMLRLEFPEEWRFVLALPRGKGLSGAEEERAMLARPQYDTALVYRASWIVFYWLIPSIIERNPAGFASALTELQKTVGQMFAYAQGGVFCRGAADLVDALEKAGVVGYGQSSWGPLVYVFAESEGRAKELANMLNSHKSVSRVTVARPRNRGALVIEE